ncbi:hypothetical protein LPJ63_001610 [Coemansia sp. RSA 2711]|nr:hypothetical protein LPJ63_001610 [Coemansia sp. RSA 2711]KAJ1849982.1 hypothetical protein LPJ70_000120 [Coemansia sp. RSA 2708]
MARSNEANGQRRRAPSSMMLDAPVRTGYRGKIIKQTIERNRTSTIKRKYFKELKKEAKRDSHIPEQQQKQQQDTSGIDRDSGSEAETQSTHSEAAAESTKSKLNDTRVRKQRSNPFQKIVRDREELQKKTDEEKRRRELQIRQTEMRRRSYAHKRREDHKRHTGRTQRGQPLLSNQIFGLLSKIKKSK